MLDEALALGDSARQPEPFSPLIGQKANGCWVGYGSALFLEFGERTVSQDLKNHPSGEWSLQCGAVLWRIEQEEHVLAGSEDGPPETEAAVDRLNGLVIVGGVIAEFTGDTVLRFSDGTVLRTFVLTTEEDARWSMRYRDGEFLPLGPSMTALSDSSIAAEGRTDS
jgi:hypothetical protein